MVSRIGARVLFAAPRDLDLWILRLGKGEAEVKAWEKQPDAARAAAPVGSGACWASFASSTCCSVRSWSGLGSWGRLWRSTARPRRAQRNFISRRPGGGGAEDIR